MPMMNGNWYGCGGLFMVVFWVFLIAAVAWLVLTLAGPRITSAGEGSAKRILEERFARGEIDAEELRVRRAAIEEASR